MPFEAKRERERGKKGRREECNNNTELCVVLAI
jgi:hypothetical protein